MLPDVTEPAALPAPAVQARELVVARAGKPVLKRSSFALAPGTVTALIGPNGSGKSTLLDAIAGLLPVHDGSLEVLGTRPRRARPRVAYVLQSTVVNELLPVTAREVVALARYPRLGLLGRLRPADQRAIDESLRRLGLAELGGRRLHHLSGGQRQRVLVAQGLAQQADVLLLDEPLSGVDVASRERIRGTVAEERRRGHTVVVATHDVQEAEDADHVLLLNGRVVASGPPSRVITSEHFADAYGGRVLLLDGNRALVGDGHHPSPQPGGLDRDVRVRGW